MRKPQLFREVHVQVQEASHNPPFQSPSEAILWHVPWQPACSSTRSQQWGSSDPLKYNNAKCTAQIKVFLLVQTKREILVMERDLSHQLPEVFGTWFWSNELEGKSHLYTSLFTPHNYCSQLLQAGTVTLKNNSGVLSGVFLWRIAIKALTAS